ncbi:MAG TPA: hypothetical protein VK737_13245 [Opitutales bacterium]|jgi:hypothetical protein|nr:hypothetical protein [Opitutales bacterium]
MKKELFDELLESVKEAAAIEHGERAPSRKFEIRNGTMAQGFRPKSMEDHG